MADEKRLLRLLEGGTIDINIQEGVIYSGIHKTKDALYTMLLTTGYLKALRTELVSGQAYCELAILLCYYFGHMFVMGEENVVPNFQGECTYNGNSHALF